MGRWMVVLLLSLVFLRSLIAQETSVQGESPTQPSVNTGSDTTSKSTSKVDQLFNKVQKTLENDSKKSPETFPSSTTVSPTAEGFSALRLAQESNKKIIAITIVTGALLSLVIILIFIKNTSGSQASDVVYGSGLVLVIFGSVLAVDIANTEQQLTVVAGILGAIVGYLFGASKQSSQAQTSTAGTTVLPPRPEEQSSVSSVKQ